MIEREKATRRLRLLFAGHAAAGVVGATLAACSTSFPLLMAAALVYIAFIASELLHKSGFWYSR
jgi:hypothetical protein